MSERDFWEGYVPEPDKRQQALDKMAENARELWLDYEPDGVHHNKPARTLGELHALSREVSAEQPAQQEPVAWLHPANATCVTTDPSAYARGIPLYTSPPAQRTWVGLTPKELDEMFSKTLKGKKLVNWVARAIEAKLRSKNEDRN